MKCFSLTIFLVLGSLTALAEDIRPIRSATLRSCEAGRMGCQATIDYEGKSVQLNAQSLPESVGFVPYAGSDVSLGNIEGFVKSTEQRPGTFIDEFYFVSSDSYAELSFCNERMMGCAPRIVVNGEDVLLDRNTVSDSVNRRIGPTGAGGSITASVKGYFAHEKGHFPNPMAYFKVFKVLEIHFPDSELIDNSDRWYVDEPQSNGGSKLLNEATAQ